MDQVGTGSSSPADGRVDVLLGEPCHAGCGRAGMDWPRDLVPGHERNLQASNLDVRRLEGLVEVHADAGVRQPVLLQDLE